MQQPSSRTVRPLVRHTHVTELIDSILLRSSVLWLQALNCHPFVTTEASELPTFRVGVSEDRNRRCRRSMEDAHSFIYDYGGVPGQGYFAVFE